jgi:hypothetical protein
MRRVPCIAFGCLALFAAACGSSAAHTGSHDVIRFGIAGGNIPGYRVTIEPSGSVHIRNVQGSSRLLIPPGRVRRLRDEIERAHLASRRCPGTLPDFAASFVGLGNRTFTVRGSCEPSFERVWRDLVKAVPLRQG